MIYKNRSDKNRSYLEQDKRILIAPLNNQYEVYPDKILGTVEEVKEWLSFYHDADLVQIQGNEHEDDDSRELVILDATPETEKEREERERIQKGNSEASKRSQKELEAKIAAIDNKLTNEEKEIIRHNKSRFNIW